MRQMERPTPNSSPSRRPELEPDEALLVQRIAEGDLGAFSQCYARTARRVYGACHSRCLGDAGAAEAAAEDVYVALWSQAHQLAASGEGLEAWLLRRCAEVSGARHRR